jgi:hypothetical protein
MQDLTVEVKSIVELIENESTIEEIVNESDSFYVVGTDIENTDTFMFPNAIFQFYNVEDHEKLRTQMEDTIHNAPTNHSMNYKVIAKNASQENQVFYHIYRVINKPDLEQMHELLHFQFQPSTYKSECKMLLTNNFFGIILPKPTSKQYAISKRYQFKSKHLSNYFYNPLYRYRTYRSNVSRETNFNYLNETISELSWPTPKKQNEKKFAQSLPVNENLNNTGNVSPHKNVVHTSILSKDSPSSSLTYPSKAGITVARNFKKPEYSTQDTASTSLSGSPKDDKKYASHKKEEAASLSHKPPQNIVKPQKEANPKIKNLRDLPST